MRDTILATDTDAILKQADDTVRATGTTKNPFGHIINGYSKLAIGMAIAALPLAVLDLFFFRLTFSEIQDWPQNSFETWFFSSVFALVALGSAVTAGWLMTRDQKILGKKVAVGLMVLWLALGLTFFVFRLTANVGDDGKTMTENFGMAFLFLIVYLLDGFFGFVAGYELLNSYLREYLRNKKLAAESAAKCTDMMTMIDHRAAHMRGTEGELDALFKSMRRINGAYVSQLVPRHMGILVGKMRTMGLWDGPEDRLWEAIGYSAVTHRPIERLNPITGEPIVQYLFDEK
jgi:MFS family permease